MKMHLVVKILIGLLSAWVIFVPFLMALAWFLYITTISFQESVTPTNGTPYIASFFLLFFVAICTALLSTVLKGFYIVHDIVNRAGSNLLRALLGLAIIFLPIIGFPFYYFIYIVPDNPPGWALIQPVQSSVTSPYPPAN